MDLHIQTNADMDHDELVKNRFARVLKWSVVGLGLICIAAVMCAVCGITIPKFFVVVILYTVLTYAVILLIMGFVISLLLESYTARTKVINYDTTLDLIRMVKPYPHIRAKLCELFEMRDTVNQSEMDMFTQAVKAAREDQEYAAIRETIETEKSELCKINGG